MLISKVDLLNRKLALIENRQAFVEITLVAIHGSAPQDLGAKALVGAEGLLWGTVGGGKIEKRCIDTALELLKEKSEVPSLKKWNLQTDIGMTCGGVVEMLFEPHAFLPQWRIAIFGAGHVGQALARQVQNFDCELTVIDSRPKWLNKLNLHLPHQARHVSPMESYVVSLHPDTFVVVMTMGHGTDLPILAEVFQRDFPYVGNMGSEVKAKRLQSDLKKLGVSEEKIKKLHCPIGENFGGNIPNEIALSVMAQLMRCRDQFFFDQKEAKGSVASKDF